jgi:hypothetical protein
MLIIGNRDAYYLMPRVSFLLTDYLKALMELNNSYFFIFWNTTYNRGGIITLGKRNIFWDSSLLLQP